MCMETAEQIAVKQEGDGMAQAAARAPLKTEQPERAERKMCVCSGFCRGERNQAANPEAELSVF